MFLFIYVIIHLYMYVCFIFVFIFTCGTQQKRKKLSMNASEKHFAIVRNASCGVCCAKDSDPDELDPVHPLLWGEYKWISVVESGTDGVESTVTKLKTEGGQCLYCSKVKINTFSHIPTMSVFKKAIADDTTGEGISDQVKKYRLWLIQDMLTSIHIYIYTFIYGSISSIFLLFCATQFGTCSLQ